jgi:co-chaperonin GroES (HSP10)
MILTKDRVLVQFHETSDRTRSGLVIIPQEAKDPANYGTVLEVGPEQWDVKVGDVIVFGRYAGIPLRSYARGPEKAVLDGHEILAVVESDDVVPAVQRTTVALDIKDVVCIADASDEGELIYVKYSHAAQSLYLTFEKSLE